MWVLTTGLGIALVLLVLTDALATTINVPERPGPMARTILRLSRDTITEADRARRRGLQALATHEGRADTGAAG